MPPPDIRVEKEASTLAGEEHEVHLLVERNRGEAVDEIVKGMNLYRGIEIGSLRDKLYRYTFSFTFKSGMWRRAISEFAARRGVELLHVHDLPLVGEAVRVGGSLGVPVIADLHENYPAGLQVWYTNSLKKKTIYKLDRWAKYERDVLMEVDAVIVVIEESKKRIMSLGIPEEKIFVVPNTASSDRKDIPVDPVILERYRDHFTLSYVGGFAPHRGLDIVIRALPLVAKSVPSIKLVLVGGRNPSYRKYIERLAKELGCFEMVEMTGWLPFEKIWSYIEASDVCLVPHTRNPHTDTTIPHKVFQYMMLGKPVIVSDCPPLKRVIEESGGGFSYKHDDPSGLAEKIIDLYGDGELRKRLSDNGKKAFNEKFNWEATSLELKDLYSRISERRTFR